MVFEVAAGYTESAANLMLTTPATNAPTATNTVTFRKDPATAGANPKITSNATGSGSYDGVIEFAGMDYVTFDAIDVSENLPTPTNALEVGYGIYGATASDASQYITIRNCTVTMKPATTTIIGGIYLRGSITATGTSITISAASGAVSYCEIYNNTITDAYIGIYATSSSTFAYYGIDNKLGTSGANIITGFGGSSSTGYGIYTLYQHGLKIENNTLTRTGTGHTTTLYGIFNSSGSGNTVDIGSNMVNVTSNSTTSECTGIKSSSSSGTVRIQNNDVQLSYTSATTGTMYGIYQTAAASSSETSGNNVHDLTLAGTGALYGIYDYTYGTSTTCSIHNNAVSNLTKTGASGAIYALRAYYAGTEAVYENTVDNCSMPNTSGSTAATIYGFYKSTTTNVTSHDDYNNTVTNLSISGAGIGTTNVIAGWYFSAAPAAQTFTGNTIRSLSIGAGSGTVYGVYINNSGTTPVVTIAKNTITGLSAIGSAALGYGIYGSSAVTFNVSNNFVSDIQTTAAASTIAAAGIYFNTGTTVTCDYNTVYLNTSSTSATTFGSAALYASSTPTFTLRNNILVNESSASSVTGTGCYNLAFRRASGTLTTYSTSSNTNCFHVASPASDTTRGIYFDPNLAVPKRTLAEYKTYMATRDQASVFELPPFINVGSAPYDLHLDPGTPTQCESGAIRITTPAITDDHDADVRFGEAGYAGMGSAPDIGADEGDFTPSDLTGPAIVYTAIGNVPVTAGTYQFTATITDASGVNTNPNEAPRCYYRRSTAVSPSVVNANAFVGNTAVDDGWKWVEASLPPSGNTYTFTLDFSLLAGNPPGGSFTAGDVIQYFVVAADQINNVAINSGTPATLPPNVDLPGSCAPITGTINSFTTVGAMAGTYTIGGGTPAGTYATLKAFFDDVNAKAVTGDIMAEIVSSTTETATASLNQWSEYPPTSGFFMTIKPAAGTTPTISGAVASSAIVKINGADRVTIDGSNTIGGTTRDLTIAQLNGSGTVAAILVGSLGTGLGASQVTIKNTIVRSGHIASGSHGISVGSAATIGSNGDDNDLLTIENNLIEKAYTGIFVGAGATGRNDVTVIRNNTVGSVTGTDYVSYRGIGVAGLDMGLIEGNEVFNQVLSYSGPILGIDVGNDCTGSIVRKNRVYGMNNTSTSGYGAYGINISGTSGSNSIRIENNMVYDIMNYGDASLSATTDNIGIRIGGGTGHMVYHNSVSLTGTFTGPTAAAYSMAFAVAAAGNNGLDIRNNVFMNAIEGYAGSKSYTMYFPASYSFAGTIINNNDYWPSGTYGVLGYNGSADVTTMFAWRAFTGQDGLSVSADPMFTSTTNPHINAGTTQNSLESSGATLGVTTDIDGDTRPGPVGSVNGGATAPDLGADEFDGVPVQAMVYVSSTTTGMTGYVAPGATQTQVIGIEVVTANAGMPFDVTQFDLSTNGTTVPADITNAKLWYTGSSSTFATTMQFGSPINAPSGAFTITGTQTLNEGTNYFWLTYDVSASATTGDFLDAECTGITVNSIAQIPTTQAPAGHRTVQGPLNGVFTVGTGGNFPNLKDAFDFINNAGLAGNTTLSITASQTLSSSAIINPWTVGAGFTLLIKPAATTTPVIDGAVAGNLIQINGADGVTIDGSNTVGGTTRDLTIENTVTSGTNTGITVSGTSAGNGSLNFTVKNCVLRAGHIASGSYVLSIGGATGGSTGYDNDSYTVQNNVLERGYYGMYVYSTSSALNSNGLIAGNVVGSTDPAKLVTYKGIYLYGQDGVVVEGNEVFGMTMAYSGALAGIEVSSYSANSIIRKNVVHGLYNSSTSTTGYGAYGINIIATSTGANIRIENNMVYDIMCFGGGTIGTTYAPIGIRIAGGTGHQIYHNTVYLTGTPPSGVETGSMAFGISSSSYNAHDIRNNIFANAITGVTGSKSYAIWAPSSYSFTSTTIDNNDYFVSGSVGVLGWDGSADASTLAAWRISTSQDADSWSIDPLFTSATNLHINSGLTPTNLESGADVIAGLTTDIDGDVRPGPAGSVNGGGTLPDIGADEFDGVPPASMSIVSSTVTGISGYMYPGAPNRQIIRIDVQTTGSLSPVVITAFDLKTTGCTDPVTDLVNAKLWYTGTSPVFVGSTAFGSTYTFPNPIVDYQITGSQALAEGINYFWLTYDLTVGAVSGHSVNAECWQFTAGGTHVPTPTFPGGGRTILGPLSGTYTVGTGGQFENLTEAFEHINNTGLTGNTDFSIISSQTLPSPATLNQWTETPVGSNYTLLVKPAASTTPVIEGPVPGNLIQINGADRVTIDGSNTVGGTTRDLSIINTSSAGTNTAVTVSGTTAGAGSTNFTLKNCRLKSGHTASGSYVLSIGGATGGSTGYDNDNYTVQNNLLERGYYGMYIYSTSSAVNSGGQIIGNVVGSSTPSDLVAYKGMYLYGQDGVLVDGNEVFGITMAYSGAISGIELSSYSPSAIIRRNVVHGINNTSTSTTGYAAYGINIISTSTGTNHRIENNMVYDILCNGGGTIGTTYAPIGIRIAGGTGHTIQHNSVYLTGTCSSVDPTGSIAFGMSSSSYNAHTIRNNIFANAVTGAAGSKSYALWSPSGYTWSSSTITGNDYFVSGPFGILAYNAATATDLASLADLRLMTG